MRINENNMANRIIQASCLIERFANKYMFEPIGMSSITVKILYILKQHGSIGITELMKMLDTTKSNLSQRLNLLEDKRYIKRYHPENSQDRRQVVISITPFGRKKISYIEKRMEENNMVLEVYFTEKEIANFHKIFDKLKKLIAEGEKHFAK